MLFYVAKGLQLAGLLGVAGALIIGLTVENAMLRELGWACGGIGLFYVGRLLESRGSGAS